MENFNYIAKKLTSLSNNHNHYTSDSFNSYRKVSHLDIFNNINSYYNGYSLKEESINYFISLYKEKLNYKAYKYDDFFEVFTKDCNDFENNAKLKKLFKKDLDSFLKIRPSDDYIEKNRKKGSISNKRLDDIVKKNILIDKKTSIIKEELDIIEKKENNFLISLEKMKEIYNEIDLNKDRKLNSAEIFVKSLSENKILSFINKKIDQGNRWEFSKSQKYEEVVFFEDDSIATLKNGVISTVAPVKDNYNILARDIVDCIIEYTFRKNKSYIKPLKELVIKDGYNINALKNMSETFLNNSQLLKNYNFDFKNNIDESVSRGYKLSERIDDKMHSIIKDHKIKQMYNSIFSNKYNFLINEKTKEIFKQIYDLKIDSKDIQKYVGSKLASFKSSEDLNNNLVSFLNKYNNFDLDSLKNKAINLNAKVVLEENNSIVLEINDYESCKELGSSSWCIVRQQHYFDSYSSKGNKQYFYFDFNKESSDDNSMIGFTIKKDGSLDTAHVKDDTFIKFDTKYESIYLATIKKEILNFKLNDKIKEKLNIKNKSSLKI